MSRFSPLKLVLSCAGFGLAAAAQAIPMGSAMVGGLFQADFVSFAGDKEDVSRTSADIRRANIWIKGNLNDDWSYQLGYDGRYTRLDTSWIGYAGFDPIWLAIGLVDAPQGLEYWSGYINETFMEYSSVIQAFQPSNGVGLYADGSAVQNRLSYQAAVYMPNFETANVVTDGYADAQGLSTQGFGNDSDEAGISGRLTLNYENLIGLREIFHFGASGRYEGVSATQDLNPFVTTPNMLGKANSERNNILVSSVIPSAGNAKSLNFYGLEGAAIFGSFMLQGEYQKAVMNGRSGNSTLSYPGYYAQATYVLTGEKRSYDQYSGTVGSVSSINNPYGAWELAFRYGHVDLSDMPSEGYDEVFTDKVGRQTDYTLGLNWYVTDNLRFMGNYSVAQAYYVHDDEKEMNREDASVKSMGIRAQVDF
jgi:phosphate-selective porin OprO and OprP